MQPIFVFLFGQILSIELVLRENLPLFGCNQCGVFLLIDDFVDIDDVSLADVQCDFGAGFYFLELLLASQAEKLHVQFQDGLGFADFKVLFEMVVIVVIVQVEAFGIEFVLVDVADPMHITETPTETDFCCNHTVLFVMVYDLVFVQTSIVDFSSLKSPFKVKTRTGMSRIFNPSPRPQSPLHIRIPTRNNKHLRLRRQPILLLPFR